MSSSKNTIVYGILAKTPEATYATPLALVAGSDGAMMSEEAMIQSDYAFGGRRARPPASGGLFKNVPPTGRFGNFTAKFEPRGLGVLYSASAFPPDIHHFMRMSGHSAVFSGGVGTEIITYSPVSTGFNSGTIEGYGRGEKAPMAGCYADFGFTIDGPGIPSYEYDVLGIAGTVETDVALPAITYNNATQPPTGVSVALNLGLFTAGKVYRIAFKKNLERQIRNNINGTGIAGYACGDRSPSLEIELEAETLTTTGPWNAAGTLNPYMLRDSGTPVNITFIVGTVQYNRWRWTGAQCICVKAEKGNQGPVATWKMTFDVCTSTPVADDDYTVIFS